MDLLRKYIREALEKSTEILIPPPPPMEYRVQELEAITYQYHNRFNPEVLQHVLDDDMVKVFDSLLVASGLDSQAPLIEQFKEEVLPVIHLHKDHFDLGRPNELADQHGIPFKFDYLESAQTPTYPSGHTTQAFYTAIKLSRIFPQITEDLFVLANMIAESRIDRGVHFPSDNEAGKLLAAKLTGEIL